MHEVLEGGFNDVPVQAAQAFRAVMTAMARPGDIVQVCGDSDLSGGQP